MQRETAIPVVFIDTSALLRAFAHNITEGHKMPYFMTDSEASRYTAEKCVYEAYMAFRGVGGKKPDEGRARWAQQYLKEENHPASFRQLMDDVHGGSVLHAAFWINNIDGAVPTFGEMGERIGKLHRERAEYHELCNRFDDMLNRHRVRLLPYLTVFATADRWGLHSTCPPPEALDEFVRSTIIPPEDLEIVYAAMRLDADIFVTNDLRLVNCSASLGLNYPLCQGNFCTSDEYSKTVERWRQERRSA